MILDDVIKTTSIIGVNMTVVSEHELCIHVAFFIHLNCDAATEHTVLENIEVFKRWLDSVRPTGISTNVILRHVAAETIDACQSARLLVGPVEAVKQVLGLEVKGEWTP